VQLLLVTDQVVPCKFISDIRERWTELTPFSYFAAYEVTKKALMPTGSSAGDLNLGAIMFAGGTAGVAMWSIAIPPDVWHHKP
jgi:hypothetical protein